MYHYMSQVFNPYTFDYKKYIYESYGLTEMPSKMDDRLFVLDDTILNQKEGIRIEKNCKFVEIFKAGSQKYRLFKEIEGNDITYYLLGETDPLVVMEYSYNEINNPIVGLENKSIWNHRWYKGLLRYFIENYVLSKKVKMISDRILTIKGFKFWKTLFEDLKKTHQMFVLDINTKKIVKIETGRELERYYESGKSNFRFVIEKS